MVVLVEDERTRELDDLVQMRLVGTLMRTLYGTPLRLVSVQETLQADVEVEPDEDVFAGDLLGDVVEDLALVGVLADHVETPLHLLRDKSGSVTRLLYYLAEYALQFYIQ